jgi:hypothetical protein
MTINKIKDQMEIANGKRHKGTSIRSARIGKKGVRLRKSRKWTGERHSFLDLKTLIERLSKRSFKLYETFRKAQRLKGGVK